MNRGFSIVFIGGIALAGIILTVSLTQREPEPPAPAPVEAAPEVGVLRIDSDIPGARVFIDREFIGTTPLTVDDVKPDTHRLNVSTPGSTSCTGAAWARAGAGSSPPPRVSNTKRQTRTTP